jgi:hypothetical protein
MNDHVSRILRTLIQLAAGGALAGLFTQIVADVPQAYGAYLTVVFSLFVTVAQNIAEEQGWIPMMLRPSNDD